MFAPWISALRRRECVSILSLPRFDRHYRVAQFVEMLDEETSKAVHYAPVSFQSFVSEIWDEFMQKLNFLRHPTKYTVFLVLDAEWLLTAAPHFVSHLQEYILRPYRNASFFFFFEKNLTHPIYSDLTRQCPALLQNVITQSLYSQEAIDHFIQHMGMVYSATFTKSDRKLVWEMCGGYIWLTTEAIRNFHKKGELTFNHPEMELRLKAVWNGFSDEEQLLFRRIVRKQYVRGDFEASRDFFLSTQLLTEQKGELFVSVPILEQFIHALDAHEFHIRIDRDNEIVCGSLRVSALFTPREQEVLRHLVRHKGEVVPRDTIAEFLWGNGWEDRSSDWGLDQAMKRLRVKLSSLGGGSLIRTVKGRGYMYQ